MYQKNILIMILLILVFCLPVVACGDGEPAAVPEEDTSIESTSLGEATSSSEGDLATDGGDSSAPAQIHGTAVTEIEQITGTWIASANPEIFYLLINPDGTVKSAPSLTDLEEGSTNTWNIRFDENMIISDEYYLCPDVTGTYFGIIDTDGTLKFTSIFDPCNSRFRHMDHSLPGRLYEYNLRYSPVE